MECKMQLLIAIIIYFGIVHNVVAQPQIDTFKQKPEHCYVTDELAERRCCVFPPFFEQSAARECGALFYHVFTDDRFNVTGRRRDIFDIKTYWHCILNKHNLLNDEDKLNNERYYSHLDKWATLNRDFSNVLASAKMFCFSVYRYQMPLEVTEFFEFQKCIRNYVNLDCPVILQTNECFEWKKFYEECREFYI